MTTAPTDLSDAARALLQATTMQKVDWILADAWVHTPTTTIAFQWMAYMHRCGVVMRPPCLHLIAEGGMGKTAVLLAYTELHPVQQTPDDPLRLQRPIVYVECKPEHQGERGVRHAILKACWPSATHIRGTEEEVDSTLRAQGVRMLLLDEFGELTKAGAASHRRALSELKRLSNTARVGIVAATVTNLAHVLDVDQQFASRFKRKITISPWALSNDLRNFVYGLQRNLPFPERSQLDDRQCLPLIAQHSEGNTKEIVEVIRLAALHALEADAAHISHDSLVLAIESPTPPSVALRRVA
ncbi:TniB family NTP-binding protein [Pseudoxanthomonas suwonensis]|uniref:TniB family NTP-binding protein n=1 Tax=Pseudoxanthomonas suwonensis TaxID=314722 RepID=UPI000696FC32|nr:TniB family NTP-binding protein [Pseudoxanthomonas suwonensis]